MLNEDDQYLDMSTVFNITLDTNLFIQVRMLVREFLQIFLGLLLLNTFVLMYHAKAHYDLYIYLQIIYT